MLVRLQTPEPVQTVFGAGPEDDVGDKNLDWVQFCGSEDQQGDGPSGFLSWVWTGQVSGGSHRKDPDPFGPRIKEDP